MAETKHTPGPWEVLPHATHAICIRRNEDGALGPHVVARLIGGTDIINGDPVVTVSEEDRRLIAAAPDMLAALLSAEVACAELCQGQDPKNQCWVVLDEVRAVITKATAA